MEHLLERSDAARVDDWLTQETVTGKAWEAWSPLPVRRIHLGNEFCDRLLPEIRCLKSCLTDPRYAVTLALPLLSDIGIRRTTPLLEAMPPGHEVIVNDWGALRLLRRSYPDLIPVAGRLLCKQIKDPRLPSGEWSRLYPTGIFSDPFSDLLGDYGMDRMEVDVPPHAQATELQSARLHLSAHLLYGYSLKGRMCKIGSLRLPESNRFQPGHGCGRECLDYVELTARQDQTANELPTFQRGNTRFYRHDRSMTGAVLGAVKQGWIDRLVIHGDWHADRRPH